MSALLVLTNVHAIERKAERKLEHALKPGEVDKNKEWITGFYSPTFVYIYRALKKEGLKISTCSPNGGKVIPDPWSLELWDHPICNNTLESEDVVKLLENTKKASEVKAEDYNLIYFCGGHGAYFDLTHNEVLNKLVADIYEKGGVVAGNMDGVVGLLNVKLSNGEYLVKGKRITGLPTIEQNRLDCKDDLPFQLEEELTKQGALFKPGIPVKDSVQSHDRIVTGQNPNSSEPLARCVAMAARKMMKIKKSVLYILTNYGEFEDGKKCGTYIPSFVYPYRELRKAGFYQTICTPKGGEAPIDPWSLELWDHPLTNNLLKEEAVANALKNTVPITSINPSEYSAVVIPGGYGGLFDLAIDPIVKLVIGYIYERGGVLCSNSHGAAAFLNVKLSNGEYLVNGKKMTALPKIEESRLTIHHEEFIHQFPFTLHDELIKQGADFKEGIPVKGNVVSHEDRIITGQNPNSSEFIARRITGIMKKRQ